MGKNVEWWRMNGKNGTTVYFDKLEFV